jgi:UDP-N-acetyl-D-glucosamine dehydrogenase
MGQGYVGLPLAMAAVKAGHRVIGYEPNLERFEMLRVGASYVEDVPSRAISSAMAEGLYEPARDDVMLVITVPTPLYKGEPDLTYVKRATSTLGLYLKEGATVILESTTHPGTTRDVVIPLLETASELTAGEDFHVGFSPERIDPGNQRWTFDNTTKIVAGLRPECLKKVQMFYEGITQTVVPAATLEEAELAKVFENTFRQVNIALVNELQRHAHQLGVDVYNVLDLCATKPFGFTQFTPGPGVGGHCIPCDPVYLTHHLRKEHGTAFRIVELAQEINESQPAYVVQRLQDALNDRFGKALKGAHVLALGQAYKPGTADMRESPAVEVVEILRRKGAVVETVDPYYGDDEPPRGYTTVNYANENADARLPHLVDYDAVVLLTPHDDFDLAKIAESGVFVLDTRGVLPSGSNIERL